ncbi:MAG: pyridoxal-dependent decarboxylase [Clostridia bacterium]
MKNFDSDQIDLKALFMGDKGENADFFKQTMCHLIDDHVGWRKNYMPQDPPAVTLGDKDAPDFKATMDRITTVMDELSCKMRTLSVPWEASGRYWGHMLSQQLMPAELAYTFAMLWNSNTCTYEASPATSLMEGEVGQQLCRLMGWKNGWGHLSACGTIANLEAMWLMRNLKSVPLAVKKVCPELVEGMEDWALLNLSVDDIVALMKKTGDKFDQVKAHTARNGHNIGKLGKFIVPQTKHYSWVKNADIVGIGLETIIECPVTNEYRLNMAELEKIIRKLAADKTPILGVVGVVGSTEEGQVDPIGEMVALRKRLRKEGIEFYLHVDGAYGGYGRTAFLDEHDDLIPFDKIKDEYKKHHVFKGEVNWPDRAMYDAFAGIEGADSVTIDPHKMGYIPYTAGGIAFRVRDVRDVVSYFADYVFEKGMDYPMLLGAFTVEGSKAGATAAAVWATNRILPLNLSGYGKLIGANIEGAKHFRDFIADRHYTIGKHEVSFQIITEPNFNIVDYIIKEEGCNDLAYHNKLNRLFYAYACYEKGGTYNNEFIVSHSDFTTTDYGNSPFDFVKRMGFDWGQWQHTEKLTVLRSCCMSPYMCDADTFADAAKRIDGAIQAKLVQVYAELDSPSVP